MNYSNPTQLQAAILDWAGTVVDFGSFAPTQIFVEAFAEFDVQVSIEEARGPMGMGKWDHIRTLCDQPQVAERYRKAFGRTPTDDDVTAIYQRFMPLQIEKIAEHSALIPGALDTIANLRQQGIKIGSCSGYPKQVMDKVVELAATNGYVADHVVATDEVPNGRPWPAQALANEEAADQDRVLGFTGTGDDRGPGDRADHRRDGRADAEPHEQQEQPRRERRRGGAHRCQGQPRLWHQHGFRKAGERADRER